MRNIIVVECISTGKNYIGDIVNRGYNPIVLHLKDSDTEDGKKFGQHVLEEYSRIPYEFDMIYEKDTFEETLEEVRKANPILIVPGNERGVVLAARLSHELGLLSNSIENLDAMTLKNEMHKRLAQKGLRSIKGKVIHSLDEALEFYDSENLEEVVIKPTYSAGSASVRICLNREEMIDSINQLFDDVNYYGDELEELLIQERINGIEYIVNTVTHKGIHRVTLVWKYNKVKTSEGAIVYDSCETVNELSLGEAEMVEYAYKVADALEIQYGPVHGEYMIDEKGPVLIEVNCRPCGGSMPAEFLDRISGQHETDSILDSYLKPKCFFDELRKKYNLHAHGTLKFFITPKNMIVRSSPIVNIDKKLKAFHDSSLVNATYQDMFFQKTEDLTTAAGYVFLINEDKADVDHDLNFLRDVERNAFSLILSDDVTYPKLKEDDEYLNEIIPMIKNIESHGTGLFVTDQIAEDVDIYQVDYRKTTEVNSNFDYVIVNLNKSLIDKNEADKVKIILNCLLKVKSGGYVFIPENTYQLMLSGRKGIEALVKVLNYKIELPPYFIQDVIIASR
ncbi:ATP-grasp domain-containing protein [uncultured Methanobrevibacter sp.]|uniref:ATP-grasp domain-containing protein n=1 Tax=uncultured Methanobrevibacter sp. TaxID=253161 RepID=UPI0025E3AEC6|nr:ATP-grasp domain-containing protein [uncultured Methanobrevibacter sp.]